MLEMKLRPLTRPVSWTERDMSQWLDDSKTRPRLRQYLKTLKG